MKITDIKQQAKRQDRYSIFIDDKYSFSLSENELLNTNLKINQEYSACDINKLKKVALEDKAYTSGLNLIARRPRSNWELCDYLKRKGYDETIINKVITRLEQNNYIDDMKFARSWVNSRRLLKSTSKRRLWQELKQKRVSEEIINQVLSEDEADEQSTIKEIIAKKSKQTRYKDKTKLMQYLLRQGFGYNDIKQVINEELNDYDNID